jgi:hypothetical protein
MRPNSNISVALYTLFGPLWAIFTSLVACANYSAYTFPLEQILFNGLKTITFVATQKHKKKNRFHIKYIDLGLNGSIGGFCIILILKIHL